VQEPKSSAACDVGVLAVVRERGEPRVDFGSESGDLTMAGLQHALENAGRNAVHDPNFTPLPSPTGKQPALGNHHDPHVMDLADTMLVDPFAEGKLAQSLKPNTVRINASCTILLRQIIGVARDKKPTPVWSAEGAAVALELTVRRTHVENADDLG
jgi:hypothetical protein